MPQDFTALAKVAYSHAEKNYGAKDARYDVIVECMSIDEIAQELQDRMCWSEDEARKWADQTARLQHEVELNQAWDGPESCVGSSKYDPRHDPSY